MKNKKTLKIIGLFIIILILAVGLYFIKRKLQDIIDVSKEKISEEQRIHNLMSEALSKNQNLTEEEKNTFYKMEKVILDHIDKIEIDVYLNLIENIRFEYNETLRENGSYYAFDPYIVFKGKSISDVLPETLTHEQLHMFQYTKTDKDVYHASSNIFTESVNVIFNNEYFSEDTGAPYDESYDELVEITNMLIRIIGSDPFINFQFSSGNISNIRNSLYEIIPDEKKCADLIEKLATIHRAIISKQGYVKDRDILIDEITEHLSDYYEAKYNRNIKTDNLLMLQIKEVSPGAVMKYFGFESEKKLGAELDYIVYTNNLKNTENSDYYIVMRRLYSDGTTETKKVNLAESMRYDETMCEYFSKDLGYNSFFAVEAD